MLNKVVGVEGIQFLACFAGKQINKRGENNAANAPHPAFIVPGISRAGEAEEDCDKRLLGVFFAQGKGLVIDASKFFEALLTDDFFFSVFGGMDKRILFLKGASAFGTVQHDWVPPVEFHQIITYFLILPHFVRFD